MDTEEKLRDALGEPDTVINTDYDIFIWEKCDETILAIIQWRDPNEIQ
ncbi:MAG: hypothetical protein GX625_01300 [Clostridiaceae bacterium]|nr:hypothetical protein [Clostridiaceae bacterium]